MKQALCDSSGRERFRGLALREHSTGLDFALARRVEERRGLGRSGRNDEGGGVLNQLVHNREGAFDIILLRFGGDEQHRLERGLAGLRGQAQRVRGDGAVRHDSFPALVRQALDHLDRRRRTGVSGDVKARHFGGEARKSVRRQQRIGSLRRSGRRTCCTA